MRRKESRVVYYGNGWVLTARELLFGVVIILVMLAVGFFVSEKIASATDEANQQYYQAVKISGDAELFQYGMRTDVGNAFVSGELEAVGPVSYPEISGDYAYVEKVKERYTQHTKQVTHTKTVNGKTQTYYTTETYWTWDRVGSEDKHCDSIKFLGTDFAYGKIPFPSAEHIDTVKESYYVRYKYYGCQTAYDGTIYTALKDGTINDTVFINGANVAEAEEYMVNSRKSLLFGFWVFWIVLTGGAVYGFCYLDNQWLED